MIKETLRDLPDDTFSETILYDTYINKSLRTKWEFLADPDDDLTSDELIENLKEILEDVAVRLQEANSAYLYLRDYQDKDRGKIAELLWKMRDQAGSREPFSLAAQDDAANRVGIRSLLSHASAGVMAPLYTHHLHNGPVTDIHFDAEERVITGSTDRSVCVTPLSAIRSDSPTSDEAESMVQRLHLTLRCKGVRVAGVRTEREQEKLRKYAES